MAGLPLSFLSVALGEPLAWLCPLSLWVTLEHLTMSSEVEEFGTWIISLTSRREPWATWAVSYEWKHIGQVTTGSRLIFPHCHDSTQHMEITCSEYMERMMTFKWSKLRAASKTSQRATVSETQVFALLLYSLFNTTRVSSEFIEA